MPMTAAGDFVPQPLAIWTGDSLPTLSAARPGAIETGALVRSRPASGAPKAVKIKQPNGDPHSKVCFSSESRACPHLSRSLVVFSQR
jgi:hypothetical protein